MYIDEGTNKLLKIKIKSNQWKKPFDPINLTFQKLSIVKNYKA
jgi:hypothetical protein